VFVVNVPRQRSDLTDRLGCATFADGCVEVNEFGQTSVSGVYAAGDMARRASVPMPMAAVIAAAASGTVTAAVIDQDLLCADFGLPNPLRAGKGLIMESADLAQTAAAPPKRRSNVPLATAGLLIGMLLSVLDQTVVAIALPDIAADLGGMDAIGWIVTSYMLASTATGALYGRISDRFGRCPVFVTAVAVFVAGSALCGLAQTTPQLIAARTFQGIGAGALFVLPTIALSELYPQHLRSRVQGLTGGIFALASVGGPLAGGAITDTWGWRWIFYINLPLGLLAMALTASALRLPKPGGDGKVDLAGAVLIAGATVSLLLVAEWGGRTYAWTSGVILALIGAVALLAALFVWWERRTANPLLPLRLFADPTLRVALPATALLGTLLGGSIVYLPTYLQAAYGMAATQAGLALNPYVLTFMVVSSLAGARVGASGRIKPYLLAGSAIAVLGFALLSRLTPDASYALLAVEIAMLGVGFGLLMQNLVVVAQNAASPADLAAATSAAVSVRGLGLSLARRGDLRHPPGPGTPGPEPEPGGDRRRHPGRPVLGRPGCRRPGGADGPAAPEGSAPNVRRGDGMSTGRQTIMMEGCETVRTLLADARLSSAPPTGRWASAALRYHSNREQPPPSHPLLTWTFHHRGPAMTPTPAGHTPALAGDPRALPAALHHGAHAPP
jgi:EmrB/QacA subfamily drug resistance transporter